VDERPHAAVESVAVVSRENEDGRERRKVELHSNLCYHVRECKPIYSKASKGKYVEVQSAKSIL